MDSAAENNLFILSTLVLSGFSLYLFKDLYGKFAAATNKQIKKKHKSQESQLNELSATPTGLHPYQKKLGPYLLESNLSRTAMTVGRNATKGENLIFKICLTGGPSSGRTTGKI